MMYTIDAKGKTLGRTASHIAKILMGKDNATFQKNTVAPNKVKLINAAQAKIDLKKLDTVLYERYSGYPGGLKKEPMKKVIEKKGYSELFNLAVYGMLPSNKLRAKIMKNFSVTE